jgi:hypothetical protein
MNLSSDSWESGGMDPGFVFPRDGNYLMLYAAAPQNAARMSSLDSIGYAYSTDGLNFTRSQYNPILSDPNVALDNVNVLAENGKIYVYYTFCQNGVESLGQITLNSLPPD